MNRAFTPEEFAEFLALALSRYETEKREGMEAAGKMLETCAKDMIGEYQDAAGPFPEWAPLSPATLEGFGHPLAGYIPGKVEQGYAPPDNPLMRTGDLRDSIGHAAEENELSVGSTSEVAPYQEYGTPNAMYPIPPRPFIGPAMFKEGEKAAKTIFEHVMKAFGI